MASLVAVWGALSCGLPSTQLRGPSMLPSYLCAGGSRDHPVPLKDPTHAAHWEAAETQDPMSGSTAHKVTKSQLQAGAPRAQEAASRGAEGVPGCPGPLPEMPKPVPQPGPASAPSTGRRPSAGRHQKEGAQED